MTYSYPCPLSTKASARAVPSRSFDVVAVWARCIALLCFLLPLLAASRLPIKTYTTADGLARDRIHCIVQDKQGFMWFCTAEGLSRFDGYRFTNYGTEQGLPHSNVTGMVETAEGVYWVGTAGDLSRAALSSG